MHELNRDELISRLRVKDALGLGARLGVALLILLDRAAVEDPLLDQLRPNTLLERQLEAILQQLYELHALRARLARNARAQHVGEARLG